jgi:hypothetical protein
MDFAFLLLRNSFDIKYQEKVQTRRSEVDKYAVCLQSIDDPMIVFFVVW